MRRRLVAAYVALCAAGIFGALIVTNSVTGGGGRTSPATTADAGRRTATLPATSRAAAASVAAPVRTTAAVAMMTTGTFDPSRIRMKLDTLQVNPVKVNTQCTGTVVIVNSGPGYEHDAQQVLPYWMLTIADVDGAEIYLGGGGWSGPMRTGERMTMAFDTHSNSVSGANGRPFVFPKPGRYTISVSVFPGGSVATPVDTKTVPVIVPRTN